MFVALASMILNALLAWYLGFSLGYGHIGLALASSISAFFTVITLLVLLKLEDVYRPSSGWLMFWLRLIFASLILMVFLGYFGQDAISLRKFSNLTQIIYILKMVFLGMGLYIVALRLIGVRIKDFLN